MLAQNIIYYYFVPLEQLLTQGDDLKTKRLKTKAFKYKILSEILHQKITAEDMAYTARGKPYLKNKSFAFNVSHSKFYYALAWTHQAIELGLDIETIDRQVKPQTKQRVLTEIELQYFQNNHQNNQIFMKFWTQKEAYIKTNALGVFMKLNQLGFESLLASNQSNEVLCHYDQLQYQMFNIEFENQIGTIMTNELGNFHIEYFDLSKID